MFRPESTTAFRPAVSADDWKTIMMAIKTYSHNVEYRELLGRLERQAVLNGIIEPTPSSGRDRLRSGTGATAH